MATSTFDVNNQGTPINQPTSTEGVTPVSAATLDPQATIQRSEEIPPVFESGTSTDRVGTTNASTSNDNLLDIDAIYTTLPTYRAPSAECMNYIRTLRERMSTDFPRVAVRSISSTNWSGLALVLDKKALALIFAETVGHIDGTDVLGSDNEKAIEIVQAHYPEASVIEVIAITREDYPKAAQAASIFANCLSSANNPAYEITVDTFRGYDFRISYSRADYEKAFAALNPHGVMDRSDIRITVKLVDRNDNRANYGYNNGPRSTERDFACIGAYTTFTQVDRVDAGPFGGSMSRIQFIPEVHISQISCVMMNDRVIPLLMFIANYVLITQGLWLSQFSDLHSDANDNAPNIGNLLDDANGEPMFVTNEDERRSLLSNFCQAPWLILDVLRGRFHIPGMAMYLDNTYQNANGNSSHGVTELYKGFLRMGDAVINEFPCSPLAYDLVGVMPSDGNTVCDSRWADYLNLRIHNRKDNRVRRLLSHDINPRNTCDTLREYIPGVEFLYNRYQISINGTFNNMVGTKLSSRIRVPDDQMNYMSSTVNMRNIANYANTLNVGNYGAGIYGGGFGGFGGFGQNFGQPTQAYAPHGYAPNGAPAYNAFGYANQPAQPAQPAQGAPMNGQMPPQVNPMTGYAQPQPQAGYGPAYNAFGQPVRMY